jgi:hypothetical protein
MVEVQSYYLGALNSSGLGLYVVLSYCGYITYNMYVGNLIMAINAYNLLQGKNNINACNHS